MKTFVLIVVIGGTNINGYLTIKNYKSYKACTEVINYVKDKKRNQITQCEIEPRIYEV